MVLEHVCVFVIKFVHVSHMKRNSLSLADGQMGGWVGGMDIVGG